MPQTTLPPLTPVFLTFINTPLILALQFIFRRPGESTPEGEASNASIAPQAGRPLGAYQSLRISRWIYGMQAGLADVLSCNLLRLNRRPRFDLLLRPLNARV